MLPLCFVAHLVGAVWGLKYIIIVICFLCFFTLVARPLPSHFQCFMSALINSLSVLHEIKSLYITHQHLRYVNVHLLFFAFHFYNNFF